VSTVLCPTQHIINHFGDESFQAITCTGTENSNQTTENIPKTQKNRKTNKLALGKKKTQNTQTKPKPAAALVHI